MDNRKSNSEYAHFIEDAEVRTIISPPLANALLRIERDENPLRQAMAAWSAVKMLIPLEEQAAPLADHQSQLNAALANKQETTAALEEAEASVWAGMRAVYTDPGKAQAALNKWCPPGFTGSPEAVRQELWKRPELLGDLLGWFGKKGREQFEAIDFPGRVSRFLTCRHRASQADNVANAVQEQDGSMQQVRQADAAISVVRAALDQLDSAREVRTKGNLQKRLYQVMEFCVFRAALPHHLSDAPEAAIDLPFGRILSRVTERNLNITFAANADALEIKRLTLSAEVLHDCVVDVREMRANQPPDSYPARRAIAWAEAQAETAYNDVLARAKEIYSMITNPPPPPPPPFGGVSSDWELAD